MRVPLLKLSSVEKRRLERPTPTSRTWCATNCATSRWLFRGDALTNTPCFAALNRTSAQKRVQRYGIFFIYANYFVLFLRKVRFCAAGAVEAMICWQSASVSCAASVPCGIL